MNLGAIHPSNSDEVFMKEALKEALKAYEAGEVPIGAVIVREGKVIARGHNQVEMLKDATAHAEVLAITSASEALQAWRLKDCQLFSTVEPCSMCAGAMFLARVERLVWGAPDLRHGANGTWVDLFKERHPTHSVEVQSGVLADPSAFLLQSFFKERRKRGL